VRTDRHTYMTKVVAAFRNFANPPDEVGTGRWFCVSVRSVLKSLYGTTPNQSCHRGSRFTLLTADAEPLRASACGLSGSVGKVLSYGNSYHVVSRVVTIVSTECVAVNGWAKMSSAQTTEAAGYTETIYTASHSRAH
jgi:hypothetical protein